jgi:predicted nucleic acid-binding protein
MASPRYLLDTNIVSDLVRHPAGRICDRALIIIPAMRWRALRSQGFQP